MEEARPCVEFYRGQRPNPAGHHLSEILTWSNGALEMDHDWVQWVFPSNEPSQMNSDAPAMTKDESAVFQADPELQNLVCTSMIRFFDFLGLVLVQDDDQGVKVELMRQTEDNPTPQWWMRGFNHNMLRVTRLLKSLRLTGLDKYAIAIHNCLLGVNQTTVEHRTGDFVTKETCDRFSENTLGHWRRAVNEPLWEEPEDICYGC